LLVPEAATDAHLQILSELAQRFSNRSFRDALAAANDAKTVYSLFAN
jgi:nitrogen PTS system EIIA component